MISELTWQLIVGTSSKEPITKSYTVASCFFDDNFEIVIKKQHTQQFELLFSSDEDGSALQQLFRLTVGFGLQAPLPKCSIKELGVGEVAISRKLDSNIEYCCIYPVKADSSVIFSIR